MGWTSKSNAGGSGYKPVVTLTIDIFSNAPGDSALSIWTAPDATQQWVRDLREDIGTSARSSGTSTLHQIALRELGQQLETLQQVIG